MQAGGRGVVGAHVTCTIHVLDTSGDYHTVDADITLHDDGAAGNVSINSMTEESIFIPMIGQLSHDHYYFPITIIGQNLVSIA